MATAGIAPEREEIKVVAAAAPGVPATRLMLNIRDVIILITQVAVLAGVFFSLKQDVTNIHDTIREMQTDIRELRHLAERQRLGAGNGN